jgi:choline dehydrogenase
MYNHYDYIIVGAGSAGCILANRLTENGKFTVCLLEAGPSDWDPFIHIPAGFIKTLYNPKINWMYQAEPSYWTGDRIIDVPRGKTLGGSSSINGHIYNRGQRMDYDTWSQQGNQGWGYADVLPYFKKCEERIGIGDDNFRGRFGNLKVTDLNYKHPLCEAFMVGAEELGLPRNADYNGAVQEGISYVQRTTYKRRRVSTARAFLNPAKKRSNLIIKTNAFVTRILLEGKTATGVEFYVGGKLGTKNKIFANKEVILSGGTINSPQLLQLSGIGPGSLLNSLGIKVLHELRGVGENLRDHYAPRFCGRVKDIETINEQSKGIKFLGEVFKYFTGGKSILNLSPSMVYGFWHSDAATKSNDIQFVFAPASYKLGRHGLLADHPGFTVAAWQHRPESKGWVRACSSDPFEKPIIQPNYLSEEIDRQLTVKAMKLARSLMNTAAMKPYFDGEEYPGANISSDEELLDAARHWGSSTYHVMGTCRMGPDSDETAVVDDRLRVKGIQRLRVIDASIMPTMLSANLNAGVMMIGEKGADMVLGKKPLESIIIKEK